jgi:hypothetical protein
MINSGMVFCDRHFGGINYPKVGIVVEACRNVLECAEAEGLYAEQTL